MSQATDFEWSKQVNRERKLSRSEQSIWLFDRLERMNNGYQFEILGEIQNSNLETALLTVMKQHPLLSVKIKEENGEFKFSSTELKLPEIKYLENFGSNEEIWSSVLEGMMLQRFEVGEAPLVRVLVAKSEEKTRVGTVFCHSISDGICCDSFLSDWINQMSGVSPLKEGDSGNPIESYEPPASNWSKEQIDQFLSNIQSEDSELGPPSVFSFLKGYEDLVQSFNLLAIDFDQHQTQAILAYCRSTQIGLTGWLGASLLKALYPHYYGGEISKDISIIIPSDLRSRSKRVVSKKSMIFAVGLSRFNFRISPEKPTMSLASEMSKKIRKRIQDGDGYCYFSRLPHLKTMNQDDALKVLLPILKGLPHSAVLSNVGALGSTIDKAAKEKVTDFRTVGPIPTPHHPLFVAATTWQGKMSLVLNFDPTRVKKGTQETIRASFKEFLLDFTK